MISQPSTAFDEPPVLPYQVTGEGEFISRVEPRPPPWDEAPRIEDDDPIMEREIVVFTADMDEARRLDQIGLQTKLRYPLRSLGLVVSVLRVPASASVGALVDELRRRHPTLWIDANHLYESQQSSDINSNPREPAAVVSDLKWTKIQRKCYSGRPELPPIGIVDSPVGKEVPIPPERRHRFVLKGEEATEDHGTETAGLLVGGIGGFEGLLPQAIDALFAAEALSRADEASLKGSIRHRASLTRLAEALDWLIRNSKVRLINVGVAGRSGLGLYLITRVLDSKGVILVAPYGDQTEPTYPAAYPWVFGAAAYDINETPGPQDQETIFVPLIRNSLGRSCGNSCAAPFVTAALWVAGAGAGQTDREILLSLSTEAIGENVFLLHAPSCAGD